MGEIEPERECRICRGEDEPDRPLLHPCRCSGSIKYTHEECLVNWLSQSGSSRCELCNHSFRFEPLYQPNTPSALPTKEFISGVLHLTRKTLKTAARIVLVFTVWLFFLPVGTCWTLYALFINSPSQLPTLLASRGVTGVVTDAFYGLLLSAGIVFVFLGISSLREYIRHYPHDAIGPNDEGAFAAFLHDDDVVPDDFEDYDSDDALPNPAEQIPGALAGEEPADVGHPAIDDHGEDVLPIPINNEAQPEEGQPPHENVDADLNGVVFDEFDEFVRDTFEVIAGGDDTDDAFGDNDDRIADQSGDEGIAQLYENRPTGGEENSVDDFPVQDSEDEYEGSESDYMDDDDDMHENEHDLHLLQNGVPEGNDPIPEGDNQHGEEDEGRGDGGALFGLFELDPDEVPLEEVVGLRGPIKNLFDNAGTVLVSNAMFLGVFTLIPLLIGRLTLRLFSMQSFPPFPVSVSLSDGEGVVQSVLEVFKIASDLPEPQHSRSTHNESAAILESSLLNVSVSSSERYVIESPGVALQSLSSEVLATNQQEISVETVSYTEPLVSYVDNFLIVLLGYGMVALIAVGYIGVMSMLRQRYPRLDSPLSRQIARMLRYVATFVKIVVLILFEFGIFPLGCGWWLDVCTLDLFGGTVQSRLSYCQESPWTCTAIHWIMGIIYMVHISLFISLLREVVRPELLWFLRNPDDPEFHPFRELVEKPLSRHARRMCISVIIYVPLILALVYVPGQLCLKLLPHVFPFRSEDFSHILIDVPFGNLLIGPLIRLLYFGRPEVSLHRFVSLWIRWVSVILGIDDLVVKREGTDGNDDQRQFLDRNERHGIPGLGPGDQGPLHRMFVPNLGEDTEHIEPVTEPDMDMDDLDGYDYSDTRARRHIRLRATVMIVLAWLTLIFAESVILAVPTVLGRMLMGGVGLPVRHDLHPFLLGLNVVLGIVSGAVKVAEYVQTVNARTLFTKGLTYLSRATKGLIIVLVWLGVVPLVAGLLFELILVPIRVSDNETPYFCMHQDWALGLLLLKVWSCIAVTGGLGANWRERVLRAREGDIIALDQNFARTMREVVIPVLLSVLTALSVPYSVARGLLPLLGISRWVSNAVYRYAYLVITCVYCGFETLLYSVSILRDLHDSIRDDKYLVGKRLYNFNDSRNGARG